MIEHSLEHMDSIRFEKDCGGGHIVSFEVISPKEISFTNSKHDIMGNGRQPLATFVYKWDNIFTENTKVYIKGSINVRDVENDQIIEHHSGTFDFLELCKGNIMKIKD